MSRGARCTVSSEQPDAASGALQRVKAAVRSGISPRRSPRKAKPRGGGDRDPQLIGAAVEEFIEAQGLRERRDVASVLQRWPEFAGPDVATHVAVDGFESGRLVLRADSTTWANTMRLLRATVERRLAEELGEGVVTSIEVLGPEAPSWRFGQRHVPGRGPRDTYG